MAKHEFGGAWTLLKLTVLESYLEAYANAFKNMNYNLIYVDAFAGSGRCDTKVGSIDGSAKIALSIDRFNEYIFIEYNEDNYSELLKLKEQYRNKKITVIKGDCNMEIIKILNKYNWTYNRALAFIDPYGFEFDFNTHKKLASTKAFDIWYLFPISYVSRFMPNNGNISKSNSEILTKQFGERNWINTLYQLNPQINLFDMIEGTESLQRVNQSEICCYFKNRLNSIYPSVSCPVCLKNSNNAPLFLLYFCIANPNQKAKNLANKIAGHIIKKENRFICHKTS